MAALDDALNSLVSELSTGFGSLKTEFDNLHDQIAQLEGASADDLQQAASKVENIVTSIEQSFASFTQDPEVPVDPVPSPEPTPDPVVDPTPDTPADNGSDSGPDSTDAA